MIGLAAAMGVLFAALGLARFRTFHNETFDLAFYVRIAWGLVHLNWWEPMVDAHFYGLHLSPILAPLGALGVVTGSTASILIITQALALALAAFPIGRIGERHLGPRGLFVGAFVWLLYPNLGHVAGYEFHPGSLAVLPLAWMALAIDRGDARVLAWSTLGVLVCREDLALVTAGGSLLFALQHRATWRPAAIAGGLSLAYALFFFLVLQPAYAPAQGSLALHFGAFGDSLPAVLLHLLTHPGELLAHLATPERLLYLPKILAPLAFLPLLRARWLLPTAPILAINLISEWPTTTDLDVHYLTPALPFLVAGALDGAGRLRDKLPFAIVVAPLVVVFLGHVAAGGTPLSLDFDAAAFRPDLRSTAAADILAAVPEDASVQAPYALLPHLAERPVLHRTSSPEANDDFFVLDAWHRRRYAGQEDLIRTVEEPPVRDWLARDDHRLALASGDFLLLERGAHPRDGLGGRAIVGRAIPQSGERLCDCLAVRAARLDDTLLTLELVAREPCPHDLALRIGVADRPRRVDLPFAGWLSPAHLRRGDLLESKHRLTPAQRDAILEHGLRVGAIRQSGARPEPDDPNSVEVPL